MSDTEDTSAGLPAYASGAAAHLPLIGSSLTEAFEHAASKHADKGALVVGTQRWSYRKLYEKSRQLAGALQQIYRERHGEALAAETPIAFLLERTPEAVACMLGILQSGACYVPLATDYPASRIDYILGDCQAPLIVTQASLRERFEAEDARVLLVEDLLGHEPAAVEPVSIQPDQLAYVLYTSGTTGKPKGVMVEHRSVLNTLQCLQHLYGRPDSRITAFTNFVFDVSVSEIYATLLNGNELHLLGQALRQDPERLAAYLLEHEIHLSYLPPAILAVLPRQPYPALKSLIFAGEPCDQKVGRYYAEQYELWNYYGPTEATIYVTGRRVDPENVNDIGFALEGMRARVLDANRQPVKPGQTGELYVSGIGLARGYLNLPEQSEEAFLPNPFADEEGEPGHERLYKTGDLVRLKEGGSLDFLGRTDFQVKINGFRVELGEIETALSSHAGIEQSLLIAEARGGLKRLIAYYQSPAALEEEQLRRHLAGLLPAYMIPHHFVSLPAFPLNANGKIDRKRLLEEHQPSTSGEGPANEEEARILAAWQRVLGGEHFGVTDDFFLVGGDSIAAMHTAILLQEAGLACSARLLHEHRTVRALAAKLEPLQDARREPIATDSRTLNEMQQLIVSHQLATSPLLYNENITIDFRGQSVSLEALRPALRRILNHHPLLRMRLNEDYATFEVGEMLSEGPDIKLVELEGEDVQEAYRASLKQFVDQPFSLLEGPLYRFVFYTHQGQAFRLAFVHHHLLTDGDGMYNLFVPQLATLLEDPQATLPAYPDTVSWPKAETAPLDSLIAGMERTDLFNNPQSSEPAGDYLTHNLPAKLTRHLEAFVREQNISLYSLLQGLLSVLLHKYSGQETISLGGVKSVRGPEAEAVYGNFLVNEIANCTIDPEQPIGDYLTNRFEDIQAELDRVLPFSRLLEELRRTYEPEEKLPSVYMTLEPRARSEHGWFVTQNETLPSDVKYPLYWEFDQQEELLLRLEYRTAIYSREQIEQLLSSFLHLLEHCLEAPQTPIHSLRALDEDQLSRQLHLEADTPHFGAQSIPALFEAAAARFPEHIALRSDTDTLSYAELDAQANQLARYLRSQIEIGPDTLIALMLPRGLDAVLAILGVLKAGAAYVPIESSFPPERIDFILEDTGTELLLTTRTLREAFPQLPCQPVFVEEAPWSKQPSGPLEIAIRPEDLAYVIYTSGSTGKPKGALLEHRQVSRLFASCQDDYRFDEQDRWCLFHSYAFDFSVWEIWGALLYGGTLLVPTLEQVRDTEAFFAFCREGGLTVLNQTPSAFYNFIEAAARQPKLESLRYVIFGGEALNLRQLEHWFDQYGYEQPRLVNMYGITETCVHVTYKPIGPDDLGDQSRIGRPLADLRDYILDAQLKPVPPGVVGELYISGAGLARAYLNRQELSRERFLENPYRCPGHERLYKTGDLVRRLPSHELEYIGRNDFQVQIRGYRVELGEIEAVLVSHPQVRQCTVLAREQQGGKHLVAWYVAEGEVDEQSLIDHLGSRLPAYMVPAHWVRVESFKLTINGKLDTRALPEPVIGGEDYQAPKTEIERAACAIWQEILGVERVGLSDDFFRIGGDSINSIKVVARLRALGLELSVRTIFEHRSLDAILAEAGEARQQERSYTPFELIDQAALEALPVDQATLEDAYPATNLQQGMFVEFERDRKIYHNVEVNAVPRPFDADRFEQVWQALIDKHELLRASYHKEERYGYLSCIHRELPVTDKIVFYEHYEEAYARELDSPFDIHEVGLFRLAVVRQQEQFTLIFTSHHSIEDGWSVASLMSEWIDAYVDGRAIEKKHELLYAHYARQELEALRDSSHAAFWQDYLADYQLTKANFREASPTKEEPLLLEAVETLQAELSEPLMALANTRSVAIDTLFLTAYLHLLKLYYQQDDLAIGLVVNNRLEAEGGGETFGLHLNTMPFRLRVGEEEDSIRSVHAERLRLFEHKVYPYGRIKADLGLEDDLYQGAFNYIHFYQKHASLDKTGAAFVDVLAITNIPLALVVSRTGDTFEIALQGHSRMIDATQLERMREHYRFYLQQLAADGQITQALLPEERQRVLYDFNQTDADFETEPLNQWWYRLDEVFAEKPALIFDGREYRYAELNEASNQLAALLLDKHAPTAGNEEPAIVALLLERSAEMIVAVLACLKSGLAYTPVDPAYPEQRIGYLLEDSQACCVLSQRSLIERFEHLQSEDCPWLALDEQPQTGQPTADILLNFPPERVVNVIYTSGTTGRPKGVQVEERGLVNLVRNQEQLLGLTPKDRMLQFASYSFDAASWEIYTLLLGTTLVMAKQEERENAGALLQLLRRQHVTVATIPPALLNTLECDTLDDLRLVIAAGEATPLETLERWAEHGAVINAYGPSETTVCSTLHLFSPGDSAANIGKPLANLHCYVLDDALKPMPVGVPGELYVSGKSLARAYLRREELTTERFVPNPYAGADEPHHQRLYKTGDRVRHLANGELEFLGRVDHQVKVRGHRIELPEIEATLLESPLVRMATALVKEREGQPYIAAYFTASPQGEADDAALVEDWNRIYENEYGRKEATDFNQADFDGWNSSYDGEAIALETMEEWRDATVERIRAEQPKRILEIGSGSGLLFYPLLEDCEAYFATDFSRHAIEKLRHGAGVLGVEARTHFTVCDGAGVLEAVRQTDFEPDFIIINSVAQYFPSCDYLLEVLRQARSLLAEGGTLFVGDVRDSRLLDVFHYDIQRTRQPESSFEELAQAARQSRLLDKELLIAPDFFLQLVEPQDGPVQVDLLAKQGERSCEMLDYRYDAILRFGRQDSAPAATYHHQADRPVTELLKAGHDSFVLHHVPNARVYGTHASWHNLPQREALEALPSLDAIAALADEHGYRFAPSLEPEHPQRLSLLFTKNEGPCTSSLFAARSIELQHAVREPFVPVDNHELRAFLEQRLPNYMSPSALIQLDAFPLTANGKIDRARLPEPDLGAQQQYQAPATELEQALCQIWEDILGLDRVGVTDDFFHLGGNSILAISLTHRISKVLEREVKVATVFEHRSILALIEHGLGTETIAIPRSEAPVKRLSYAQNRLWFIEQYEQGSRAYNIPIVLKITDARTDLLEPCIRRILERHEVLRSCIVEREEQGVLELREADTFTLERCELSNEAGWHTLLEREFTRPFKLEAELPIRGRLCRLEQEDYLLLTVHHIAFDGWSVDLFLDELTEIHEALLAEREPELPELPVQYSDFACWQRDYLGQDELARQLAYWTESLEDFETLQLPQDHPRPREFDYAGANLSRELPTELVPRLRKLAREEGVTLNALLLALFKLLLSRYSGQEDIVCGTPIANRHYQGTEHLLGFFVNSLPLRTQLSESTTLTELIHRVHDGLVRGQGHQDVPFERIVDELGLERDTSRHAIFQVMFSLQTFGQALQKADWYEGVPTEAHYRLAKHDLTCFVTEQDEALRADFNYATSLFDEATVARLADSYLLLLEQAVTEPTRPLADFAVLNAEQRHWLTQTVNENARTFPERNLLQAWKVSCKRHAEKIALSCEGHELSYAALDEASSRLATCLREQADIQPEDRIALCLERGPELFIGMLAILKLGAAYLPVDTDYPPERIRYLLEDSQARLALTLEKHRTQLEEACPAPLLALDTLDLSEHAPYAYEPDSIRPEQLAYVIYTSGTTGRPKGVLIEQRSVCNYIGNLRARVILEGSVVDYSTSLSFDLSVTNTLASLMLGCRIAIFPKPLQYLDDYLAHLKREQVEVAKLVPSLAEQLFQEAGELKLKLLIVGGEKLKESQRELFLRHSEQVVDEYGPTETTVGACYADITRHAGIGRAYHNFRLYVLDRQMQPVPIGVPGELWIGGIGVARGYHQRAELTAECFVEDPFAPEGGRLYKSGDLVRRLASGELEYLGRADTQVKLRGYRIECAEIEALLAEQEAVQQAAVLVHTLNGTEALVAYYVAEQAVEAEQLREALARALPDYMLPTAWQRLEALPLTANGKLDVRKLPEPAARRQEGEAPATQLEAQLAAIWCELLGLEAIGVCDDFFRSGGDSIQSIQLVSRLRRAGFSLSVKDLFDHRSVRELASHLAQGGHAQAIQSEQGRLSGSFGLLPIQQHFFDECAAGRITEANHWNQSFFLKVPALTISRLEQALAKLVQTHDQLRVRFARAGERYRQSFDEAYRKPTLELLETSQLTDSDLSETLNAWQQSLDLEQGPLWKVAYLYEQGTDEARLFFTFHHLIIDTVSWRLLAEDLQHFYEGEAAEPKGTSYRQWVQALTQYASHKPDERHYWERQLALPDAVRSLLHNAQAEPTRYTVRLDKRQTQSLLSEANEAYRSEINDLLLTALARTLAKVGKSSQLSVTLEGHGRDSWTSELDVSRTLGWFTNLHPLALEVEESLPQSLRRVKEALRARPAKGIGYGAFADTLEGELPATQFNYLGVLDRSAGEDWALQLDALSEGVSPRNRDGWLLNINGAVAEGTLFFDLDSRLDEATSHAVAEGFRQALLAVLEHCCQQHARGIRISSPSDHGLPISLELFDALDRDPELLKISPATSLQQGFISHALAAPEDDAYRVQFLIDYDEPIDAARYKQAWEAVLATFPILRTRFHWDEQPLQLIQRSAKLSFYEHDLRDEADPQASLRALQEQDRQMPFALDEAPLLRIHLIRTGEDRYTLLRSEHHAISDGWSGPLLMQQLHAYYAQLGRGEKLQIREQESWMAALDYFRREGANCTAHWQRKLREIREVNDLSPLLSKPLPPEGLSELRAPAQTFTELPLSSLRTAAETAGSTLNAMLQYAWGRLIADDTFAEQTVVGTVVSGRSLPVDGIETSVGLYINTLPLLIDWSEARSLSEQLRLIGASIAEMNSHSFAELAALQRGRGRLFHSLLVFENYPDAESEEAVPHRYREAFEKLNYPLAIVAREEGDTLLLGLKYDQDYLEDARAAQLLERLQGILEAIPTELGLDPSASTSEVEPSGFRLEGPTLPLPAADAVSAFEQVADRWPERPALRWEAQSLNYAELDAAANRLARHLKSRAEIGADSILALALERGPEMIIAMLAALKAGAAWLPLAPDLPSERFRYTLEDAKPTLLLTSSALQEGFEALLPANIGLLTLDTDDWKQASPERLTSKPAGTDLAYVIYTSGTTGRPKGVMTEHAGLLNISQSQIETLAITEQSRLLQFSNYVFDASIFEIFPALLGGACLCLMPQALQTESQGLLDYLERERITTAFISTAVLKQLGEVPVSSLEVLYTGGEALDGLRTLPGCRLVNHYGPTEASVCSLQADIQSLDTLPIGRPIRNMQAWLLDARGRPAAEGALAELHLSGIGLARGYLNRPELTAETFRENPWASDAERQRGHGRLYPTGDLVHLGKDGQLYYVGRRDQQVKIRGYRIETREIEQCLLRLDGIEQAVVAARSRGADKQLVAWYTAEENLESADIRTQLGQELPDYMQPAALIRVDSLPLTPSGKVDIAALPEPSFEASEHVAPEGETELRLSELWKDALGLARVGATDNFYQLGGDSISAIGLTGRINEVFERNLPVSRLLEGATVRQLASELESTPLTAIESGEI